MWEVIVGNVGTVYQGDDEAAARKWYAEYVIESLGSYGRASGEAVTLLHDGETDSEIGSRLDAETLDEF